MGPQEVESVSQIRMSPNHSDHNTRAANPRTRVEPQFVKAQCLVGNTLCKPYFVTCSRFIDAQLIVFAETLPPRHVPVHPRCSVFDLASSEIIKSPYHNNFRSSLEDKATSDRKTDCGKCKFRFKSFQKTSIRPWSCTRNTIDYARHLRRTSRQRQIEHRSHGTGQSQLDADADVCQNVVHKALNFAPWLQITEHLQ